jgi:RNA polymerase sigma factor (sigma-70 family)
MTDRDDRRRHSSQQLAPRGAGPFIVMTPLLSATLLRTQSDARLATLAREGNERAFEAIVERYRRGLHGYLRRMLPESRTEDALQQSFIKAWTALREGGVQVRDLKPWLYRIAHNTALDALKKVGYDYEELEESLRSPSAPDADLERRTVIRETLAGVAALPERQREALLRVAVEGQSRAQVAHDLGLSDGAVRQLVHRARMTLRAAATAITPLPLASWAAASREHGGGPAAHRVAELAAGGGAAGGASVLLKGGAVIVAAGALAVAPSALKPGAPDQSRASGAISETAEISTAGSRATSARGLEAAQPGAVAGRRRGAPGTGASSRGRGAPGPRSGASEGGGGGPGGEDRGAPAPSGPSVSSGPGGGGQSNSGPGGGDRPSAGLQSSGTSGGGTSGGGSSSGPGPGSGSGSGMSSSGDGSSGSGPSPSGSSGSGSSGSGTSGSGRSTSGDGSSHDGRR